MLCWAFTIQPAASISNAQISYAMTEQKKQKWIKEWRKNLEKLVFLTNNQRNKRVFQETDRHIAKRTKLSTCNRLATHFQLLHFCLCPFPRFLQSLSCPRCMYFTYECWSDSKSTQYCPYWLLFCFSVCFLSFFLKLLVLWLQETETGRWRGGGLRDDYIKRHVRCRSQCLLIATLP